MNRFQVQGEKRRNLLRVDPAVRQSQAEKLAHLRSERDAVAVSHRLAALQDAAAGSSNLMFPILDAVKAYATLGEVCDVLRKVFGEYKQVNTFAR